MIDKEMNDAYEIFRRVFLSKMTREQFYYKHLSNPDCDENISTIVDYESGKARGTNSFMGCVIRIDQQDFRALQSCDTAVLEQYRGKHIFSNLITRALDYCNGETQTLLFGFPNQNSYPGFIKLGFKEIGEFENYYAVLRPFRFALSRMLHFKTNKRDFEMKKWRYGELDYEMSMNLELSDADLELINGRKKIFIKKSKEFYEWKLKYMPKGKVAYIYVRKEGALRAFFVLFRRKDSVCEMADWFIDCEEKQIIKGLNCVLKNYCDVLSVMMINPATGEQKKIKNIFWIKRNSVNPVVIYVPSNGLINEKISEVESINNWELRLVDTDYILNGW